MKLCNSILCVLLCAVIRCAQAQTPTPAISCGGGETALNIQPSASADDGYLYHNTGASAYGDITCDTVDTATTMDATRSLWSGKYYANIALVDFDATGLIPAGAVINSAALRIYPASTNDTNSRNLDVRYYDAAQWPIDCTDWVAAPAGTTAFSTAISGIATSVWTSFALSNLGSISTTGKTGFRVFVDGGEPTGLNKVSLWTLNTSPPRPPLLELCYAEVTATPTATETNTPTPTNTPTATPTSTKTPTATPVLAGTLTIADSCTMPAGVNYFHAWFYVDSIHKFFGATFTSPSKLVRFNDPDDLCTGGEGVAYDTLTFPSDGKHAGASDAFYDAGTDSIYVMHNAAGQPLTISKVNPTAMTAVDLISDLSYQGNFGSITTDGTYLYVVTNRPTDYVLKYNLTTGAYVNRSGALAAGHAIRYDGTNLWVTTLGSPASIFKVIPSTLAYTWATFASGDNQATDDLHVSDSTYVWVGIEGSTNMVRVTKADLSLLNVPTFTLPSWGVWRDVTYIWSMTGSNPAYAVRVDPVTTPTVTVWGFSSYVRGSNELAFDNQNRAFITFYTAPAQVVRINLLAGEPTFTPTNTTTPAASNTPTPTLTPTGSATPTNTNTPTSTPTNTPTVTLTPTPQPYCCGSGTACYSAVDYGDGLICADGYTPVPDVPCVVGIGCVTYTPTPTPTPTGSVTPTLTPPAAIIQGVQGGALRALPTPPPDGAYLRWRTNCGALAPNGCARYEVMSTGFMKCWGFGHPYEGVTSNPVIVDEAATLTKAGVILTSGTSAALAINLNGVAIPGLDALSVTTTVAFPTPTGTTNLVNGDLITFTTGTVVGSPNGMSVCVYLQ